ncbi:MAG: hypothetical protein U1A78_02375 [Polyangia bacterium]
MRLYSPVALITLGAAAFLSGCTHFHTNMLTASIKTFSSKVQTGGEKVWVTSVADSACDSGCQSPMTCGSGGKGGKLGGMLGFGGGGSGGSSHDRLAYEVISNYLTQAKKLRVVETHRHNYATDTRVETRKKIDVLATEGKTVATTMSCEDLCLLDEAKKRSSDKVLAFRIIRMESNKLTVHYRYSDVKSGLVEASHTISVTHPNAVDTSFIEPVQ